MNHGWALWGGDGLSPDRNPYAEALVHARPGARRDSGVGQLRSLLCAIDEAHIQLQSLRLGYISWRFLELEEFRMTTMKNVLVPLKQFELHISTGRLGAEETECREFLDKTYTLVSIRWTVPPQLVLIVSFLRLNGLFFIACLSNGLRFHH